MHGRIADALLFLHDEIYCKNPFILSISRQDLADLTAMSKENVIRVIKVFKDQGLLKVDGNIMEILDKKELIRIGRTG